jgi:myxalamid-type polyketide synthase MxaB
MDVAQLTVPLGSKIQGTWNLQQCLAGLPIALFLEFSSVASVLGSPGQSNYAAGNAFLDGMAAYRRQRGDNALCINWGPWADSGMAAEAGREKQLAGRGMSLLAAGKALEALDILVQRNETQAAVMAVSWPDLLAAGSGIVPPLLKEVVSGITLADGADSAEDHALRETLQALPPDARREKLQMYFITQLAQITGLEQQDIDPERALNTMGLDSLMAIELKNKVERRLKIVIPMTAFLHEPSVASLARHTSEAFSTTSADQHAGSDATAKDAGDNGSSSVVSAPQANKVQPPKFLRTTEATSKTGE